MRKDRLSTTIDLILLILFTVSSVFLCIQVYLSNILSLEGLIIIIIVLILLLIIWFSWILVKKNPVIRKIIMFIISFSFIVFSISLAISVSKSKDDELATYYQMNVVVPQSNEILVDHLKLGVLVSDRNHLEYFKDVNQAFNLNKCEIKEYQSVTNMLKGIKENNIQGMILSDHNLEIVKSKDPSISYEVIANNVHRVPISHRSSEKSLKEPFTVLLLMNNSILPIDYVTKTDQAMILFVDPTEKRIHLLNIPNNLYIPNMAYDAYPDALYNVSYNGIDNMLYSLQNVFGFEPDYFMKMNLTTLSTLVDVFQGIKLNSTECVEDGCQTTTKFYRSQDIVKYYQQSQNFSEIYKAFFEKKNELNNSKLVNLLNAIKKESFTNLNMNDFRTFITDISVDDTWELSISNFDFMTSDQPCISFGYYQNSDVSIVSEDFLMKLNQYMMKFKHIENMNHFEFNLNMLHEQILTLPVNEKLITTKNMSWKIDMLFSLLPTFSINPVEVEKWQGDSTIEHPHFNPNKPIDPYE